MDSRSIGHPVELLRRIGLIEGVSFLLLMGVAMPLKYAAGMPMAVKVVGWAHGVLFVSLIVALLWTMVAARWPIGRGLLVFIAALIPFGPFLIDSRIKRWATEFDGARPVVS